MKRFLAILKKESLLLIRDWPGLLILFVMPALLLIIITLTQESVIPSKKSGMKIAMVDLDSAELGQAILKDLKAADFYNLTVVSTTEEVRMALIDSKYHIAIIIPDSSTEKLYRILDNPPQHPMAEVQMSRSGFADVLFLFDPTVQKVFRDAVTMPVNSMIQLTAAKVLITRYINDVNVSVKKYSSDFISDFSEGDFFDGLPEFPYKKEVIGKFRENLASKISSSSDIVLPLTPDFTSALVNVEEEAASETESVFKPSALQNNIPAFTLFAMFFIVIPLAGSIISEKHHGTFSRMRTLPVTFFEVISAKITVFLLVCILQFIFLMIIGKFVMPALGELSAPDLNVNIPALLMALFGSSFAAIGFGIITGAVSESHGQAATFGSVMVVILALLGGIFVPVHMLPDVIRKISIVSPLRWGTDAFLGVFGRYDDISGILPEICMLTGFFILSILISVRTFRKN